MKFLTFIKQITQLASAFVAELVLLNWLHHIHTSHSRFPCHKNDEQRLSNHLSVSYNAGLRGSCAQCCRGGPSCAEGSGRIASVPGCCCCVWAQGVLCPPGCLMWSLLLSSTPRSLFLGAFRFCETIGWLTDLLRAVSSSARRGRSPWLSGQLCWPLDCSLTLNENCACAVTTNSWEGVHTTFSSANLTTGRCFFNLNLSDLSRSLSFWILFKVVALVSFKVLCTKIIVGSNYSVAAVYLSYPDRREMHRELCKVCIESTRSNCQGILGRKPPLLLFHFLLSGVKLCVLCWADGIFCFLKKELNNNRT